jgi:hypothetical protein
MGATLKLCCFCYHIFYNVKEHGCRAKSIVTILVAIMNYCNILIPARQQAKLASMGKWELHSFPRNLFF